MLVKVQMLIETEQDSFDELKKIERHSDWLLDLASWPEIKSVSSVSVEKIVDFKGEASHEK